MRYAGPRVRPGAALGRAGHWLRKPGSHGRWLAWVAYSICESTVEIPSRRYLAWNTKRWSMEQEQHFFSETPGREPFNRPPFVEVWLFRIDVTTRTGQQYVLWRAEGVVQLDYRSGNFEQSRIYSSGEEACAFFTAMARIGEDVGALPGCEGTPW